MKEKILTIEELKKKIIKLKEKKSNNIIVTTNGCFDIIHRGHLEYLEKASSFGDLFVVLINSDSSVKRLKGNSRPINNQYDRAYHIASLTYVNYVVIFNQDTPCDYLEIIKPSIHVKGGDYNVEQLPENKIVTKYGGKIKLVNFIKGYSTTRFINKIKENEII